MTLARQVQQCGRTVGGTFLVTDEAHHKATSGGLAPEYTMRQLYTCFQSFTRDQFNVSWGTRSCTGPPRARLHLTEQF